MRWFLILFLATVFLSCGSSIYIVRHAEKAAPGPNMSADVPLTDAGKQRALALRELLKNKRIRVIYSTNTLRTRSTAEPLASYLGLGITTYGPLPDSLFIETLKEKKKNILVVGHSNTVDDIANKLCGKIVVPGDLKDPDYDNLFVVKRKGKHYSFTSRKYGTPSK